LAGGPESDTHHGTFDAGRDGQSSGDDGGAGGDDAGGNDGSTQGDAPSLDDAGSDAPIGPNDGGTSDTGGGASFCASLSPKPLFCADFDEGSATAGWDSVSGQKGTASLNTSESTSAPASMAIDTVAISSGQVDCAGYKLFPTLVNKALTMTLAFDVRFDATDAKKDAVIGSIQLNAANGTLYEVQVDVAMSTSGDLTVDVPELTTPTSGTETYVDHTLSKKLALGQWHHIVLLETAPASSGSGSLVVTIDGSQAFSGSINVLVSSWTPEVIMGTSYIASPSSAWSIRYDNVTFDAK